MASQHADQESGLACLKERDSCMAIWLCMNLSADRNRPMNSLQGVHGFLVFVLEKGMDLLELLFLAIGLSMDAFAVAICAGLSMAKSSLKKALIVGLYFGVFQAGMPLIGYLVAGLFADSIIVYDHWIAFGLLSFLGGKMIIDSFKKEGRPDKEYPVELCDDRTRPGGENPNDKEQSLKPSKMLPLAVATSIDALAVGVSFVFLEVNIVPAILFIGITTLVISMTGVKIGNIFGSKFKSKAQLAGGIILVLIGVKILLEHLHIIIF